MFGIFTDETSGEYKPVLLDPHTTGPGGETSSIVRNDERVDRLRRESEIFHRARQIYYRARRTSMRRTAEII